MHEHDCIASVEFLEDRIVNSIPQPLVVVAGHEPNPICLEDVKRVLDLAQAAPGVRQGYCSKETEAARVALGEIGRVFVRSARRLRRRVRISEPHTGRRKAKDRSRDALLIHRGDSLLRRPTQPSRINLTAPRCGNSIAILREVKRWEKVMMYIDETPLRDDRCLRKDRHEK